MTTATDGLFEDPKPNARLRKGDRVVTQTMWGDEECTVLRVHHDDDGFPLVKLKTGSGDEISVNVSRVRKVEP